MNQLFITPAAISYLTQLILSALITGYLVWLARKPGQLPYAYLLPGFFAALTAFTAALFLEAALLPTPRLSAVFLQNSLLAISLVFLLRFAYQFPILLPELRRESQTVLSVALFYALWECGLAVYRFYYLGLGQVKYRDNWNDYVLLLLMLWVPIAFLRQVNFLRRYSRPKEARSIHAFILIFLFVAGLAVFNILRGSNRIGVDLANLVISSGMLLALFLFSLSYLSNQPKGTSFLVRFSGVTLTLHLVIMGAASWVLSPAIEAHYEPAIIDSRTLHFTPNPQGGYNIAPIPFQFEQSLGPNLGLDDGPKHGCSTAIAFPFPFYGKTYPALYACNDGTISLGQPTNYRDYQFRYGSNHPLILALLIDLDPTLGDGGIYAAQTPDRLVITWDQVYGFRHANVEYTVQAVLYPDGVFDLSYNGLPTSIRYRPNDDPGANVWAIGAVPGNSATAPEQVRFTGKLVQTGPSGAVQDFLLDFRVYFNQMITPFVWLIVGGSLLVLFIFPSFFYFTIVKPLAALLRGVQHLETGDYAINLPVQSPDEIGYLTGAFNSMASELNSLITHLSVKVNERTAELAKALTQAETVSAELAARNEELDAFAHTVAHDIRGPVANVALSAHRLDHYLNPLTPEEASSTARAIVQSTDRLARILDELLLLAGVRKIEVQPVPLNMAAILLEAYNRLDDVLAETGAVIELPELFDWPLALGHPAWVEEIWANYLSNACHYGGLGERPAHITVGADMNAQPGLVRFWVRDEGKGLTPAEQARLFMPFTQLSQVRAQGHGLGLSIVRRIAEKLDGEASVESTAIPGQGSLFTFTLPAAPPGTSLPAAEVANESAHPTAFSLRGLRVLLVDDESIFAESMRSLLSEYGLNVVGIAHNGAKAVELSAALNPQVILMDIDMPQLSGLQAARAIKAAQPRIKIVMLTAIERDDTLFEAMRGGASGYLLKGAPIEIFIAHLAALARGEVPLSPGLAERVLRELSHLASQQSPALPTEGQLTDRQWDILARVAAGETYKQIAADLFLSERTIKYHMGQIIDQLHVSNRTQAISYLRSRIPPPE